ITTNTLTKENKLLNLEIQKMNEESKKLNDYTKNIEQEVTNLRNNELKRQRKEKLQEKQILIRDLFNIPIQRLSQEIEKHNLNKNQINIYYKTTINSNKLSSKHPLLYQILDEVSKEFGVDVDQMLTCFKQKKQSNDTFHLQQVIKAFANGKKWTKNYDLNEFLRIQDMYPLDSEDSLLLQPIFKQMCRIINKDRK
ncbi:unnamed protein product, partial [Rotaria sordida]